MATLSDLEEQCTLPPDEAPTSDVEGLPIKRLYTLVEAAHLIGIHIQTARRLAFIGEFPVEVIRLGRRHYVRRDELDAFLSGKQ